MNNRISAIIIAISVFLFCSFSFCFVTHAEGLLHDGIGFKYVNEDGTYATNCRKSVNYFAMHFNELGYADVTGWDACAGNWKNTKKGQRYFFVDGRVPSGNWLLSDGNYYTFKNGYVVNPSNTGNTTVDSTIIAKNNTQTNLGVVNSKTSNDVSSSISPNTSTSKSTNKEVSEHIIMSKEELERVLDPSVAWATVERRGKKEYPYGFKLKIALMVEESAEPSGTWFLKAPCTITEITNAKRDAICEGRVTGTTDNPVITHFLVY